MHLKNFINEVGSEDLDALYDKVGKNVRKFRKRKKMSQLELAVMIGHKSPAFLANAENNARNQHFNLEHLLKISKVLDVDMYEFFLDANGKTEDILEELLAAKQATPLNNPEVEQKLKKDAES